MTAFVTQPVIAAGDWEGLIGIIVFVLYGVMQLFGARQEAKAKKQPKPPRPPRELVPREMAEPIKLEGAPPAKPRNQEEALRSEVEEFLRRAQGKPPERKPVAEQPAKPRPELDFPERRPLTPKPESRTTKPARPASKQRPAAPTPARSLRQEGVAEHVARHLSREEVAARTKALGEEVALADDKVEARLHEKFDHELGRLEHHEQVAASKTQPDIAADIAAMLRTPQGMRQLIIANEILRRPEW